MTERTSPVTPRDAASLLLYRPVSDGFLVLMGRRTRSARFMPEYHVYPGGVVEPVDAQTEPFSTLDPALIPRLAVQGDAARAQAVAMAAVRECFEESGARLDGPGGQGADLAALRYIGRSITPMELPMRFHARFFACNVQDREGFDVDAIQASIELDPVHWVSLDEQGGVRDEQLKISDVTAWSLQEFARLYAAHGDQFKGDALYTRNHGRRRIRRGGHDLGASASST